MVSTDREILLDISGQVIRLNTELKAQRSELQAIRAEQRVLHEEQRVLTAKIDGLQHSLYWGLSIIGIIIALFALWLSTPRAKQRQTEITPQQPAPQPILIQLPPYPYETPKSEKSA